jgi:hypothetical protein
MSRFLVGINDGVNSIGGYQADGVVAGDSGTIQFPVTIRTAGNWSVALSLLEGGGKIAIDNFAISRGSTGPWRRDFENGFVLVNPTPAVSHLFGVRAARSSKPKPHPTDFRDTSSRRQ